MKIQLDTFWATWRPLPGLICIGVMLALVLTACGTNGSASSGSTGSTPTTVKGYGTAYGCPSDAVVTSTQAANVTLQPSQANTTINAHTGDVIEVRLPFGSKWTGPQTSQGNLELQTPSGYAMKGQNVCVWRFVAKSAGTAQLTFQKQALCQPGQLCPQYIMNVPFIIQIQ